MNRRVAQRERGCGRPEPNSPEVDWTDRYVHPTKPVLVRQTRLQTKQAVMDEKNGVLAAGIIDAAYVSQGQQSLKQRANLLKQLLSQR